MAKKNEALASRVPVREKVKELGGLFFFLCAAFVLISLVSYDAGDIRDIKYPPNSPLANKGGVVGAKIAHALLSNFGLAAYLAAFFTGFWAFMVFFRRKLDGLYLKLTAVVVSVFAAATFLSLQSMLSPAAFGLAGTAPGLGGIYGKAFEIALLRHLGHAGAWLAVALALSFSLVLSTDWMIYVGFLKLAKAAGAAFGRVGLYYSAEERARRHAAALETAMAQANAEIARRAAAVPAPSAPAPAASPFPAAKTPAPVLVPTVAEPVRPKPIVLPTAQEQALHVLQQPAASTVLAKPAPRLEPPNAIKAAAAQYARKEVGAYEQPPIDIFESKIEQIHGITEQEIKDRMMVLEGALREYDIDGSVVNYEIGPAVTTYEVQLAPGQQIHAVTARQEEITMRLSTLAVRIVAPLPGKGTVGIEVPNPFPNTVRLREFLDKGYADLRKVPLPMILGKTNSGDPILRSLTELPHLLIAGTTGSGKSVCLKTIITSLVVSMSWEEMKLILIDPKQVELTAFSDIPHLWAPVVVDSKKAAIVLDWLVKEMEERYTMLNRVGVEKIDKFNKLGEKKIRERLAEAAVPVEEQDLFPTHMPYIVTIIDELADLMLTGRKEVELSIVRLAQKARAIGIHLVVATQRPSTDIVTGLIRSNMPSRVAFRVPSQIESRIILDSKGAERLLGKGDMLVKMIDAFQPVRGQCTYISDDELKNLVKHLRSKAKPEYHSELLEIKTVGESEGTVDDELFGEAVELVLTEGRGSTSLIQRHFSVGYSRAARLVDAMTKGGILGPHNGSNARDILVTLEQWKSRKEAAPAV